MDYPTLARALCLELKELRKLAPDWWHASQVSGAQEMLSSSIYIYELNPPKPKVAAPGRAGASRH